MKNTLFIGCVLSAAAAFSNGAWASDKPEAGAASHAPHWTYKGHTGAAKWGDLQADFATCKIGREQSPIDIRGAGKADLPPIDFGYVQSGAEVVNNGHTIQVNLSEGGTVKLATGTYKLLQFHFHTPSEEKIKGVAYPMVAHLVHKNDDGGLAVVAVLFQLGKKNPALTRIFKAMPHSADGKADLAEGFNASDLLPAKQSYYAFVGSLTTPPCSEGVRWQVLKNRVQISKGQLHAFQRLYPMNARPVQPLNGRSLQQSS